VNLLFYGPPKTGKSEFAKTLGAHVGFSVHFIGATKDESAETSRTERIAALMIVSAVGGLASRTIIVVDEADDLFVGVEDEASSRRSKALMNRLLERAVVPTIWIANDVDRLGSAMIRRMNLVLRFPKPALSVRKRIVSRIAKSERFPLDEASALELAGASASPAFIENAIRSAAQIGASPSEAVTVLESCLHALGRRTIQRAPSPTRFDPALSSADVDLVALADQVARARTEPSPSVSRVLPERESRPTPVTSLSASIWMSWKSGSPISARCGSASLKKRSPPHSKKPPIFAPSSSSTKPTRCCAIAGRRSSRGKSPR
jgi:transitional endoplasmic reticulum ATPase